VETKGGGLKIVYLSPAAGLGGAERCLLDMMAAVRKADSRVDIHLLTSVDGPLIERARQLDVTSVVLPMPRALIEMGDSAFQGSSEHQALWELGRRGISGGWSIWRYAQLLRKTLARLQPNLIHSNGIKFHLLTSLTKLPSVPIIWHIHDFLSLRPLMGRALRWASRRAQAAIAVSQAVQQDAQKVVSNLPVELIYNGIDTDEFSPGSTPGVWLDQLAKLTPGNPETIRIGLVATYARWKGHEVFLRSAGHVLKTLPQSALRFFIIGGPIYQTRGSQFTTEELRTLAIAMKIENRVGFVPFQENPADVYRALDIVVHASTKPEPFGRTIVEAMACGKPVIAAQSGGAAELFTHDHDAVGVPPGDPAALAAAIRQMIEDADRRQGLAGNARQTVVERFSRRRLGPQLLSIYRRLLHPSVAA
jgi:glycosyltransferase involved in cell wall biosynthesis